MFLIRLYIIDSVYSSFNSCAFHICLVFSFFSYSSPVTIQMEVFVLPYYRLLFYYFGQLFFKFLPIFQFNILLFMQATLYPGLCEPISQGGLGFDYYVNFSVSEMWAWLLQNVPDDQWSVNQVRQECC